MTTLSESRYRAAVMEVTSHGLGHLSGAELPVLVETGNEDILKLGNVAFVSTFPGSFRLTALEGWP